jgi:hypothetical protein
MQLSRLASLMRGLLFSPATREKLNQFCDWEKNDYEQPLPPFIKWTVLHRFGITTAMWVVTVAFQGDTAEHVRCKAMLVQVWNKAYNIKLCL